MSVTAELVKELREKTGAGFMDCKKALVAANGDVDSAVYELRKKGLTTAAKKSSRVASEGVVCVAIDGKKGAVVEINSETDFVARNKTFQNFALEVAKLAIDNDQDSILEAKMLNGNSVKDNIIDNIAVIGENQNLRRSARLSVDNGVIVSYIHSAFADNLGKVAVLVALESKGDTEKLNELGKQIAMHVAATKPQFNTDADVDPAIIEAEKNFLTEQALAEGKPPAIVEKMIEGRMRKFKEEIVLEHQIFIIDGSTKISKLVEDKSKEIGAEIKIKGFINYVLGEGIEKKEENFADEVAETIKKS
jgi:elongation factor Ts